MAKNKYEIARGNVSPPPYNFNDNNTSSQESVSTETAQRFIEDMRDIIDERIEKRIIDGQDIAQVYTAEIINKAVRI